jgi:hypothetical protein
MLPHASTHGQTAFAATWLRFFEQLIHAPSPGAGDRKVQEHEEV